MQKWAFYNENVVKSDSDYFNLIDLNLFNGFRDFKLSIICVGARNRRI